MKLIVAGERLELLPERAVYWPGRRALLVADVHVGKAETFQRAGIPVPSAQGARDLDRLSQLIDARPVTSVWVLGDLLHGREAATLSAPAALVDHHPTVAFHLIRGNHDLALAGLAAGWGFTEHAAGVDLAPFRLCHEPGAGDGCYVLAGHLHPVARIRGSGDSLRLPCFHFTDGVGVLPAFTEFSGGVPVDLAAGRTFVIADGTVVEVGGASRAGRGRRRDARRR